MAHFYHDSLSNEDASSQWLRYLQNRSFFDDITKEINNQSDIQRKNLDWQTAEIKNSLENYSEQQIGAIKEASSLLTGCLESGFNSISNELELIYGQFSDFMNLFDWRMSMLVENQRISNVLQENIALLLRIPDFQKERQYHIEHGLKYLINAGKDEDLYQDALDHFLKAEASDPNDYFLLHRIGMIYLYAPKMLDIARAEMYFRKAGKYAQAESHPDSARLTNILSVNVSKSLGEHKISDDSIKKVAAESFYQAGICCYVQEKYGESVELCDKALELDPELTDAAFTKAKSLAGMNKISLSVPVLKNIISDDRYFYLKSATDLDLGSKNEITDLLEKLKNDIAKEADEKLSHLKNQLGYFSHTDPLNRAY